MADLPEIKFDNTPVITNSEIDCFMTCQVKHFFRYVRQIVSTRQEKAMDFGSAVHAGLAEWFKARLMGGSEEEIARNRAMDATYATAQEIGLDSLEMEKAAAMVQMYTKAHFPEPFRWKVLDVEVTLSTTQLVGNSYVIMSGKLDALLYDEENHLVYILDHKTASSPNEDYYAKVAFDNQMHYYAAILERLLTQSESDESDAFRTKYDLPNDTKVGGFVYDVLTKPLIRQKKGESDGDFVERYAEEFEKEGMFVRHEVSWTRDDNLFRVWRLTSITGTLGEIRDHLLCKKGPYPNTSSCLVYSGCPYFGLCKKCIDPYKVDECDFGDEYAYRERHSELSNKPN